MTAITVLLGAMVLCAGYVAFCGLESPAALRCDSQLPDEEQCPAGEFCIRDRCVARQTLPSAGRGESCLDRHCESPFKCRADNLCHAPDEIVAAPTCKSPAVRAALERFSQACKGRTEIGELANAGCSAEQWRNLLADDKEVAVLLGAFPDPITLYFPANEPKKRTRWPAPGAREYVLDQLSKHREGFRRAEHIFLIGRASPDGNPADDKELAIRRLSATRYLLEDTLGWKTPTDREGGPLIIEAAQSERAIPAEVFASRLAGKIPPIAASAAESERIALALVSAQSGAAPSWLEKQVNRVVLIVPVPCALGDAR